MQAPDIHTFTYKTGEEALLVHLFQNENVDRITTTCDDSFFFDSFTRDVFRTVRDYVLNIGKGGVDYLAIKNTMQAKGSAEISIRYMDDLRNKKFSDYPNVTYIIGELKNLSTRRQIITTLHEKLTEAQNKNSDIDKLLVDTEDSLVHIETGDRKQIEVVMPNQLVRRRGDGLSKRYNTEGIYTGWEEFDKLLSVGFAPGKLSVIAARTSMGKSFFKTNMIINMCHNKVGVLNICPEQGFDSEHDRIDSIMTGVYLKTIVRIRELERTDDKIKMLKKNVEKIAEEWKYACVPSRNITVAGVRSAIRRVRRNGVYPNIVFIDLFDRLEDVNVGKERTANISVKLGQIERIAEEENIHMCILVQVNRGPESRKDKRPNMSDLRECGNYEQDADNIFLLYREGYYTKEMEDNMLDVEIAKQRDGVSGVTFQFMVMDKQTLAIAPQGVKAVVEEAQGGD